MIALLRVPAPAGGERQCRKHLLHNGRIVRSRLPGERAPDPCDFWCTGECQAESDDDVEADAAIRMWHLCGGRHRTIWPTSGSLEDQDAVTVSVFELLDALVAQGDAVRAHEECESMLRSKR